MVARHFQSAWQLGKMGINIGYAQDIITPTVEKPCYLAGFGRKRRAVAVHDDLYVRALALDDVLLFAVPGELLPKLGLNYRQMMKAAGAELTGIIGLANDELGYILPREAFITPENYLEPGNSYEESMSVSAAIGPLLTRALQELLESRIVE